MPTSSAPIRYAGAWLAVVLSVLLAAVMVT